MIGAWTALALLQNKAVAVVESQKTTFNSSCQDCFWPSFGGKQEELVYARWGLCCLHCNGDAHSVVAQLCCFKEATQH